MTPHRFTIPLKQERLERAQSVLIIGAEDAREMEALGECLTFEQDDAALFKRLQSQGLDVKPRVEAGAFDRALVFLGKFSERNRANIGRAWNLVKNGGDILVEGAKTDGADSIIRGLRALGLTPEVEPKFHGKIAWFAREDARVGNINAWAGRDDAYINQDGFLVRPGIFSPKSVDKGTAFFLEYMHMPLSGKVADFGSGYGAISRPILAQNDKIEALDAYESSYLAAGCAEENLTDQRAHIHWLDVAEAAKDYYDVILSNPPFHQGRDGDPSIGLGFIDAAARSLRARGAFYMVANRHLPYEQRLSARFGKVELVAENNAYKIYKSTRPDTKNIKI